MGLNIGYKSDPVSTPLLEIIQGDLENWFIPMFEIIYGVIPVLADIWRQVLVALEKDVFLNIIYLCPSDKINPFDNGWRINLKKCSVSNCGQCENFFFIIQWSCMERRINTQIVGCNISTLRFKAANYNSFVKIILVIHMNGLSWYC